MVVEPTIESLAAAFEDAAPQDVLRWASETYPGKLAVACSFGGASGMVLVDMIAGIDKRVPIYYLDTGLLFEETYKHAQLVAERYGVDVRAISSKLTLEGQSIRYGPNLWERDPDLCCKLRKVEPQREFLSDYAAWVSGIRRDQSSTRANADVISWDVQFQTVKINPLAMWSEEMVWAYIHAHDVPYNELLARGYTSVGCRPCTDVATPSEGRRAGRWRNFGKTECGLHSSNSDSVAAS